MKILKDSNETVAVAMRYLPAEHCVGWSAKVAASLEASGLVKPTRVGLERLDELWAVLLSCHSFTLAKVNAHFNYGQKLISWHETYSFLLETQIQVFMISLHCTFCGSFVGWTSNKRRVGGELNWEEVAICDSIGQIALADDPSHEMKRDVDKKENPQRHRHPHSFWCLKLCGLLLWYTF